MRAIFAIALALLMASSSLCFGEQAILRFTHTEFDFGNISGKDHVDHEFEFSNTGDSDLVIEKIAAASGSTKAVASSNVLKPGEKGTIRVSVDLRGKKGIFSKTVDVHTNYPSSPVTTLTVKIAVKDQIHMSQYHATEIFSENCKECHVDRGKGKTGWDLFKADCFMCHNAGKSTTLSSMAKKPAPFLRKVISEGIDNTLMPGFLQKNGGPLTEAEINSLLELIRP